MRSRIGLAYGSFVMIGANDGALGVLLPSIGRYYSVDKSTISLLFLFGTGGYMLAAFTSGLAVDKLGIRRALLLSTGLFLLGAGLLSLALPFAVSLLGQLLLAFGIGIIDAGFNSYIAGLPRNNTVLLNYLHAFYGVGALIGPAVASGLLALGFAWNNVYLVWVLVSLVTGAGIWLAFWDGANSPDSRVAAHAAGGNVMAGALKLRAAWLAGLFLLFYVGSEVSVGNWSYTFLTEERHQAPLPAGWTVSGFWLGLTLGRLFLGRLANRLGNRALIELCLAGVVAGLLLVWLPPFQATAIAGLWLTGFSLGPIFPTTIAEISRMVRPRLLPSAIGFAVSTGSVGAAFLPWLAGILAQNIGLWTLMPYVITLTGLMLLAWWVLQAQPTVLAED
jgi:fucose permease